MLDAFTLNFPPVSPFSFQRPRPKESELSFLGDDFDEKVENEGLLALDCLPVSNIRFHSVVGHKWDDTVVCIDTCVPFLGALAMEALHRQVLPFLLRYLKEDVLQDLPPKIIQDYYCELSPLQVSLLLWPTIKVRHWVDVW